MELASDSWLNNLSDLVIKVTLDKLKLPDPVSKHGCCSQEKTHLAQLAQEEADLPVLSRS